MPKPSYSKKYPNATIAFKGLTCLFTIIWTASLTFKYFNEFSKHLITGCYAVWVLGGIILNIPCIKRKIYYQTIDEECDAIMDDIINVRVKYGIDNSSIATFTNQLCDITQSNNPTNT